MAITEVQIKNPSAASPLRISVQSRRSAPIEDDTPAQAARSPYAQLTAERRAELNAMGSELVSVALDGLAKGQTVQWPRFQAEGATTLASWVTAEHEKREAPRLMKPKGTRIVDSWSEPAPFDALPAHAGTTLRLEDNRRYLLESKDSETVIQISSPTATPHTLRLRTRDKKGNTQTLSHITPGSSGAISVGENGAIIEQCHV